MHHHCGDSDKGLGLCLRDIRIAAHGIRIQLLAVSICSPAMMPS